MFVDRLADDLSAEKLHATYLGLYRQAFVAMEHRAPVDHELRGVAHFSYNMAFTRNVMVLCPRTADGAPLTDAHGSQVGWLGLNGTVLGGTALVKTEEEFKLLTTGSGRTLAEILRKIGLPAQEGKVISDSPNLRHEAGAPYLSSVNQNEGDNLDITCNPR